MPSGSTLAMLLEPSTRLNSRVRFFVNFVKFDGCGTAFFWTWCLLFAMFCTTQKTFIELLRFQGSAEELTASFGLNSFEKSLQNPRGFEFKIKLDDSFWKARFCVFYFSKSRVFERWGLSRRSIGRFAPSFVLLNSLCFVSAWEPHTKVSVTYAIMWQAHDVWFPTP